MTSEIRSGTPTAPITITDGGELESLVSTHDVVLVDFYADWCGPCQLMESTIDAIAADTAATVVKVDVDAFQQVAMEYDVRGVPTLVVFVDGEPVERLGGLQSEDRLASVIAQHAR